MIDIGSLVRGTVLLPVRAATVAVEGPPRAFAHARRMVDDASDTLDRARELAVRITALVDAVEVLVADIAATAARAAAVAELSNAVAVDSAAAVMRAQAQLDTTAQLLDSYAPALVEIRPVVSRAADALHPRHADSIAQLLDLTPEVVDLITPALRGMGELTPELDGLFERLDAIGQIVEGIPGAGMFKRRGSNEHDDDESRTPAASTAGPE